MSFDISSKEERLDRRLFLEASAGTGKTFVIEHYITRSILADMVIPSGLFLITFTRAVADELKVRLQKTLEQTCDSLLSPSENSPAYLSLYLKGDDFQKRQLVRKIEDALSHMYEATISTIHGFCDRLLALWDEKTGDFQSDRWMSDYEQKEWILEYLRAQSLLSYGEWKTLGKRYGYDENGIVEEISSLLQDPPIPIIPLEDAVEKVRKKISCSNAISSALVQKAMQCRSTRDKKGGLRPELLSYFAAIEALIRNGVSDEILCLLQGLNFSTLFASRRAKSEPLCDAAAHIVDVIVSDLWPSLENYVTPKGIVRRVGADCSGRFSSYLALSGKKTPETILQRTVELSSNADFCAMAADVVRYLIVDEFQDTDGRQWEILSRLFVNNPLWKGSVLVVGDPKQAIYGFRKADVYSYFAAKEAFEDHRTLSVNYRAEPRVVRALNRLFAGPEHPWLFYLPKTNKALHLAPVDSGRAEAKGIEDERGALHFFIGQDSIGRKRRWPHEQLETKSLFPWLADEMISLQQKDVAFRSQAILVRDRYQAKRVQQFLNQRKIPTCAWRVEKVTESPFYHWLHKAFLLAARPFDQKRLSALLLCFPDEQNKALCREMSVHRRLDRWARCVKEWTKIQEAFYRGGIGAMGRALFSSAWDGRRSTMEWLSSFGPQAVIDVEHILELLSLLERDITFSLESFEGALLQLQRHFSQTPELLSQRIDPDDEGAPILTMHKSKGLEFDVVFALGCCTRTPVQESIEEGESEKIRQLYVSVTRARKRCYLPVLVENDEKKIVKGSASPVEILLSGLFCGKRSLPVNWVETLYGHMERYHLTSAVTTLCEDEAITSSFISDELRNLPVLKEKGEELSLPFVHHALMWKRHKYSSFSSMKKPHLELSTPRDFSINSSALFGTQFHEAIAQLILEEKGVRTSLEKIEEWVSSKVNPSAVEELASLLHRALNVELTLQGEKVSLHEIKREKMRVEAPFQDLGSDGLFYRGSIDVLFEWKEAIYVLDWKTNVVSGDLSQYVEEHGYDLQASLYKEAVHRAYMPHFRWGGFIFVFVREHEGIHYVV